jgi:hypothetical protein
MVTVQCLFRDLPSGQKKCTSSPSCHRRGQVNGVSFYGFVWLDCTNRSLPYLKQLYIYIYSYLIIVLIHIHMIHFQLLMAVTHLARPRWQSHAQRVLWCWSHSRHPGQFCAQNNGPAAQEPWRTEGAPPLWANLLWTYRMAGLGDTNWWGGSKAICKWVQRCDTFLFGTCANCCKLQMFVYLPNGIWYAVWQSSKRKDHFTKLPCQEFVPLSSTQSNLFKWKHLRASYEHLTSILRASPCLPRLPRTIHSDGPSHLKPKSSMNTLVDFGGVSHEARLR